MIGYQQQQQQQQPFNGRLSGTLDLCNGIVKEGSIPEDWKSNVVLPIYKGKGDPMKCGSYRGIKLLEHAMKLLHPFNGPFSGTTQGSQYQKGKTNLDFTEARDSEWQWHQLGHIQVCTSLQTDNHASTPPLQVFYRPDALPAGQPTASKH